MSERTYLSCTETAKLTRQALKVAFPGVKFSVRSSNYSGGASLQVWWVDGPRTKDVDAIAGRYAGGRFDGMTDSMSYVTDLVAFEGEDIPRLVHFGADFVFCDRTISPAYNAILNAAAQVALNESAEFNGQTFDPDARYPHLACRFDLVFIGYNGWDLIGWLSNRVDPNGVDYPDMITQWEVSL